MIVRPTTDECVRLGLRGELSRAYGRRGIPGRGPGGRRAGGGGGTDVAPPVDSTLSAVFDGSSQTGTNANTAGNADAVSFGTSTSLQHATLWTLSWWEYRLAQAQLVSPWSQMDGVANRWMVQTGSSTGSHDLKVQIRYGSATPGVGLGNVWRTDSSVIRVGEWVHYVWVTDLTASPNAARCALYVDGAAASGSVTGGSIPGSIATSATDLRAAQCVGVSTATVLPFQGMIRGARLWVGKALSASEAATVYAGGAVSGETAAWPMNGDFTDSVAAFDGTKNPVAPAGPQFVSAATAYASGAGLRILALGDSITDGSPDGDDTTAGAWRGQAQLDLYHRYGRRVNFVGPYATHPSVGMLNIDHDGIPDRTIGASSSDTGPPPSARNVVVSHISTYAPDMIVLLLGTNDITDGQTGAQTAARMASLLDEIYAVVADTFPVIVCTIPQRTNAALNTETVAYNTALATVVSDDAGAGRAVTLAAVEASEGSTRGDSTDGVHPGPGYYRKIGGVSAAAINSAWPT